MEGTRQEVIGKIVQWIDGDGTQAIFAVQGAAGAESQRFQGPSLKCAQRAIDSLPVSFSCESRTSEQYHSLNIDTCL